MSLLGRAKFSVRKRLLSLHPITAFQPLNFYSTKTTRISQKTQQLTKPRTQNISESSSSFSQGIKKQAGPLTFWPKPREIPYQAKVANFLNLIGCIKAPVRFEADSDGKHFAATVISQESIGEKNSLLIPVVFEGDLAHVVACHVKENDCVSVSGQLSMAPMPFAFGESLGKFYVVAENINFVEGLKTNVSGKRKGVPFSGVEIEKPVPKNIEEVITKVDNEEGLNRQWEDALEHAKAKRFSGVKNDWASSVSVGSSVIPQLHSNVEATTLASVESKPGKGNEESGESANKKKNGDPILDLWRDLVENPLQWWDYRNHKSNGFVKEKFPDFKRKGTGEGLWVNSAPNWVLPGLEKLEFDVKATTAKQVLGGDRPGGRKNDGKGEDSWKNLVENPNEWWDNRLAKRHPKAPDFKHKETGEGLWLDRSPYWVLPRLPPHKDGKNTAYDKKKDNLKELP